MDIRGPNLWMNKNEILWTEAKATFGVCTYLVSDQDDRSVVVGLGHHADVGEAGGVGRQGPSAMHESKFILTSTSKKKIPTWNCRAVQVAQNKINKRTGARFHKDN